MAITLAYQWDRHKHNHKGAGEALDIPDIYVSKSMRSIDTYDICCLGIEKNSNSRRSE
jgi:hypothetical protein